MAESFNVGGGDVRQIAMDDASLVIAVPVVGRGLDQVRDQWRVAAELGADLIEWRADALEDPHAVSEGPELRKEFGLPVLYTIRSREEGGLFRDASGMPESAEVSAGEESYAARVRQGLAWADMIDVEWHAPGRPGLVESAREHGVPIVASHHVLTGPVLPALLRETVSLMASGGASIAKVAWAVQSDADVEQILAAQRWAVTELPIPTVLIGMGDLGSPTRVGHAARLSAFTFAVGSESSAPGQLAISEVRAADR